MGAFTLISQERSTGVGRDGRVANVPSVLADVVLLFFPITSRGQMVLKAITEVRVQYQHDLHRESNAYKALGHIHIDVSQQ